MAVTTLATARTSIATALAGITTAQIYRRRQTNYQYPAIVVGWPQSLDVRPTQGDARDIALDVFVGCEVTDDDSTDDLLSSLLESVVAALLLTAAWDVQPATDFGEAPTDDNRVIIWCRLPVLMLA